jgi:hypothetical protein
MAPFDWNATAAEVTERVRAAMEETGGFVPMASFRWPAVLCLGAAFALQAQPPARNVDLRAVAVDSAGQPVPDLTASDFKVYDNGSPQKIVSVHLNQTDGPSALVILFDLLNSSFSSRGEIWAVMKRSLAHLPSAGNLYLYLLVDDGSLYPVHPLGSPEGAADANSKTRAEERAGQVHRNAEPVAMARVSGAVWSEIASAGVTLPTCFLVPNE